MSTMNLEQIRLKAVQLINEGKHQYLRGNSFFIKKNGFELMKQGCQELVIYAKTETDQEYRNLATQKLDLYYIELKEMKAYLAPFEQKEKEIEEQNRIKDQQNRIKDQQQNKNQDQNQKNLNLNYEENANANANQTLRNNLSNAIINEKPNVKWDDIAGLEMAKQSLHEAIVIPIKFPDLFQGARQPWTGILLYGPPGTGKTFLAKACATECNGTFFSVSSADLISKYQGESEKLIKQLFQLAREKKPSIIFIDEIDSLASNRENSGTQENMKGVKNQLLIELSGVGTNNNQVLVLGATNIPWNIDSAIRRRFEKRIYIPLPDLNGRLSLLQNQLRQTPNNLTQDQIRELAQKLDGYSGSDINTLIRDASYEQLRIVAKATHFTTQQFENQIKYVACSTSDQKALKMTIKDIKSQQLHLSDIQYNDFLTVLPKCKPSVAQKDLIAHEHWTAQFGQQG